MSSKVLSKQNALPEGAPRVEALQWRQAGQRPSGLRARQANDDDESEVAQMRARVAELEAGLPAAVEQGRREGIRAAEDEASRAAAQLREELARTLGSNVAELTRVRHQMRRQMEEDLVGLAVVVARRVVRRELTVDPEALLGIARAAVEQIEAREIHHLRVAPGEAELMKKLLAGQTLPSRVSVVADATLKSGSLIFETARGTVDASIEAQLAEIDRGLADVLRRIS